MIIEVNNDKTIKIEDACLIIRDGRLYNTVTKQYEGVDGDRVTFHITKENGAKCWISGTVDGYTCNRRIKLRGGDKLYATSLDCLKIIEVVSKITDTDYKEELEPHTKLEEDWEAILSA